MSTVTLHTVAEGLKTEGLLANESDERLNELLRKMADVQPWYVRVMVGFGAWLASLTLISFVAGIGWAAQGGFWIIGSGFIVAAVFLRRETDNDFMVQASMAASLAGQALLAFGIIDVMGGSFETLLVLLIVIDAVLFIAFPDATHRVLMVLFMSSAFGTLLYAQDLQTVVPLVGPILAGALAYLWLRQGHLVGGTLGAMFRPLVTGLMLSAFGFLILSTIYILPELQADFAFYPRPWLSTLLLGAILLAVIRQIAPKITGNDASHSVVLFTVTAIIIAAAWAIPGLLLALIVLIIGAEQGNRIQLGVGAGFLAVFLGAYFYGIEVTMATKSMTLVATGCAVLLARWALLNQLTAGSKS